MIQDGSGYWVEDTYPDYHASVCAQWCDCRWCGAWLVRVNPCWPK
jgi:hypothetical protein